jgi:regulation of enolase protein 1 (concanavalin A-like superfamily)
MKKLLSVLVLACVGVTFASEKPNIILVMADDQQKNNDRAIAHPPKGFRWDKPVPEDVVRDKAGLILRNQAGRIWAGEGNRNRLLTIEPVAPGAAVTIDLELQNASHKYEQAGLVLHRNDDTFVKFVVEHIDGVHYVVMGREIDGKRKVLAKIAIEGARADLRLQMRDGQAIAQWRPGDAADSAPWRDAGATIYPGEKRWRFGVFSQDANPDRPGSALIRKIELKQ